jgi:hypothetical protein
MASNVGYDRNIYVREWWTKNMRNKRRVKSLSGGEKDNKII